MFGWRAASVSDVLVCRSVDSCEPVIRPESMPSAEITSETKVVLHLPTAIANVGVQKSVEWQGRQTRRVSERCQQCYIPRICFASPDKRNTLPCLYSSGCTRDDFTTGFSQRLAVREFNIVAIRVANEAQITSVGVQKRGTEL
jgi:hypothetical protein